MPHRIFREWLLYAKEEPFGQMPLRIGYATAMLGSLWGKPKGRNAWRPYDFMPDAPPERKATTPQDQFTKILAVAQLFGAKIEDPKGKLKRMIADNA